MKYRGIFRAELFRGQNILVTGGGSGIGRSIALELAQLGASVALMGRTEEKLKNVQKEIQALGASAVYGVADIRELAQVQQALAKIQKDFFKIDGLVNNAGGQFMAPLEKISPNGFSAVVKNNLHGTFHLMQEVFSKSMREHGGSIVNIIANMQLGMPMMAHSGAARAGVENLTKSAAFEWAQYGIRVNAVSPGYIASSGMDNYGEEGKKWIPRLKEYVPLRRLGTEAEVASAVCFLLSPAASYINGITMGVDGGAAVVGNPWPLPETKRGQAAFESWE